MMIIVHVISIAIAIVIVFDIAPTALIVEYWWCWHRHHIHHGLRFLFLKHLQNGIHHHLVHGPWTAIPISFNGILGIQTSMAVYSATLVELTNCWALLHDPTCHSWYGHVDHHHEYRLFVWNVSMAMDMPSHRVQFYRVWFDRCHYLSWRSLTLTMDLTNLAMTIMAIMQFDAPFGA